jgi:hypothetical protein
MTGRHRTYWVVRRRYRLAGYVGSILSTLIAAVYLVPLVQGADVSAAVGQTSSFGATIALLMVAAIIPPLAARLLWRIHRRRYLDDIYPLSIV